jgi:hypothetical protein
MFIVILNFLFAYLAATAMCFMAFISVKIFV